MVKRECEEPAAEEQPGKAAEEPAAKARRTATWGEDKTRIQWAATMIHQFSVDSPHSAQASAQTATPNATMALQAAAEPAEVPVEPKATAASKVQQTFEELQMKKLVRAEWKFKYWFNVVQREKMQLQAHRDGTRRQLELQLPEVRNHYGEVVGHYDPDPDISRLHIKVWTAEDTIMWTATYVCFLDASFEDTIGTLKTKIQKHPDVTHMTLCNMVVFYQGKLLSDADTLHQHRIDDDCILHAVNGWPFKSVARPLTSVAKASAGLHQWQLLLHATNPHGLQ